MRKVLFLILFIPVSIYSQEKLKVEKGKFYSGETQLNVKDFVAKMESNPEAFQLAEKAQKGYSASIVIGYIGGFMVGWPLGTAIGGGQPEWGLLAAGAGILAVAIPISVSSTNKIKDAAEIYNNGQQTSSRVRLQFNISPTRTGLLLHF